MNPTLKKEDTAENVCKEIQDQLGNAFENLAMATTAKITQSKRWSTPSLISLQPMPNSSTITRNQLETIREIYVNNTLRDITLQKIIILLTMLA